MSLSDIKLNCEPAELQALVPVLRKYGYELLAISELLGLWDLAELNGKEYAHYIWRCQRDESDLAKLVSFFLLGQSSDRQTVTNYLGENLVRAMEQCSLILEYKGQMVSTGVIFPCSGKYFFTDQWCSHGVQTPGKVYEIGPDSYMLARVTPRRRVQRALDLCTGSGIHAVLSAVSAETSKAVDINPRALRYAEINAALNSVSCECHLKDLFAAVPGETFDLITANPPFVPSPDPDVLIHRSAGETGEEVPERLVSALPEHLASGGLFSMVLDHPVYENESYLDKLESWLGQQRGWGIAVLTFRQLGLGAYIMNHLSGVPEYEETFELYLESYSKLGFIGVEFANVFIQRLDPTVPNWKVSQKCNRPRVSIVSQVENWLDCMTTYQDSAWEPAQNWRPALSSYYKNLWRDWNHEQGVLEMTEENYFPADPLGADEAELLSRMKDGKKTVGELREAWVAEGREKQSFTEALRGLGLRRALTNPAVSKA